MNGALLVIGALGLMSPSQAAHTMGDVFSQEAYQFCRDEKYPLTVDEHAWCPILEGKEDACPALKVSCKAPPAARSAEERRAILSGRSDGENRGDRDSNDSSGDPSEAAGDSAPSPEKQSDGREAEEAARARRERDEQRIRERDARRVELPQLGGLGRILFFVLVGALAIAVIRAIWKNILEGRDGAAEKAPEDASAKETESPALAPRGPVETDVERLLSRARAAAARGAYSEGLDDAYAALLRRLDGDGVIDIHPSRTNGDYVRLVRDNPDLRRVMRAILTDVERTQFGSAPATEATFNAVFNRVVALVTRAAAVFLLVIAFSSVVACDALRRSGDSGEAAGQIGGTSPSGTQALIELLNKSGMTARYGGSRSMLLEGQGTLILMPGVEVDELAWSRIHAWVAKGDGSVIVAGATLPSSVSLPRSVTAHEGPTELEINGELDDYIGAERLLVPVETELEPCDSFTGDVILRRAKKPYAYRESVRSTRFQQSGGQIIVFADERLFTNIALTIPENAAFVSSFVGRLPPTVEIVDAFSTGGSSTPFESVANAKMIPVILQLLALAALFFLWKGRAFADLRDPPERARRAFADHARALGLAYARARASRHALGLYASWALERIRERVHRSGRQGLIPLAEAIAARTGRSEAEVMRVLMDATGARDEASPPSLRAGSPRSERRGAEGAQGPEQGAARDLALMRELEVFLAAVGVSGDKRKKSARREAPRDDSTSKSKSKDNAS